MAEGVGTNKKLEKVCIIIQDEITEIYLSEMNARTVPEDTLYNLLHLVGYISQNKIINIYKIHRDDNYYNAAQTQLKYYNLVIVLSDANYAVTSEDEHYEYINDHFISLSVYRKNSKATVRLVNTFTSIINILSELNVIGVFEKEFLLSTQLNMLYMVCKNKLTPSIATKNAIDEVYGFISSNRLYKYNNGKLMQNIFWKFDTDGPSDSIRRPNYFIDLIFATYNRLYLSLINFNNGINNENPAIVIRNLVHKAIVDTIVNEICSLGNELPSIVSAVDIAMRDYNLLKPIVVPNINIPDILYKALVTYYLYSTRVNNDTILIGKCDIDKLKDITIYDTTSVKAILEGRTIKEIDYISTEEFNDLYNDDDRKQLLEMLGIKNILSQLSPGVLK